MIAPSAANSSASAFPCPRVAPVTIPSSNIVRSVSGVTIWPLSAPA
jgi:hypothetical protein